jgi:flagellar protein FlgJ
MDISAVNASTARPDNSAEGKRLREAAVKLEGAFLAEMLKSAGLGKARSSLGGGAGEDQFASLLVRAQADALAEGGGIGLAESLFQSMMRASKNEN